MRRFVILAALLSWCTQAWGLPQVSVRKVYGNEIFTASDKNADETFTVDAINLLNNYFPGTDSLKITRIVIDSLHANSANRVTLVAGDTLESTFLDINRRANVDTLVLGSAATTRPIAGTVFSLTMTAPDRAFFSLTTIDTVRVRDSLTVATGARATIPRVRIDTLLVGSATPTVGFTHGFSPAGARTTFSSLVAIDTLRVRDSLQVSPGARAMLPRARIDTLLIGSATTTVGFTGGMSPAGNRFTFASVLRADSVRTDCLTVAGPGRFSGSILPFANDGAALGSATVSWADGFWASGAVQNFNNGDVTITHAADALTAAGGAYTFAGIATEDVFTTVAVFSGSTVGATVGGLRLQGAVDADAIGNRYFTIQSENGGGTDRDLVFQPDGASVLIGGLVAPINVERLGVRAADNGVVLALQINATQANITASDVFTEYRSTSGVEGTVAGTASAGVIAYNTFTGAHYAQLSEETELIERGMLVEATGEVMDETTEYLPFITKTSKRNAKAVYGAFSGKVAEGVTRDQYIKILAQKDSLERGLIVKKPIRLSGTSADYAQGDATKDLYQVLALGTGLVLVTDTGGNVETGDLIASSPIPGYGERQMNNLLVYDDLVHSYTIAKATMSVNWDVVVPVNGIKRKMLPCVYK